MRVSRPGYEYKKGRVITIGDEMPQQGKYWLATLPHHAFTPWLAPEVQWVRGQLEIGSENGFLHWQVLFCFTTKKTLHYCREKFGPYHFEFARSTAAAEYVWKEDTRVQGTQFELGRRPHRMNSKPDWDIIWNAATAGDLLVIPANVRLRSYAAIRSIQSDYAVPSAMERQCFVYWGATGTGKSRRAWERAGINAYPKDPRTKWWDGYRSHEVVVMDEFRGCIDIAHLLRWLDRYPVLVEVKGSSVVLNAKVFYITSNLHPCDWYPGLDPETLSALLRRINITHFN